MTWRLGETYNFGKARVRYTLRGGGPDLVLVHGTPWSSFSWHRVVALLEGSFRCHLYDLVGFGQSDKRADQRVGLDVQGELLAALIDHWGLRRPLVAAHDIGGATALRAHLVHGVDYARLALLDAVALTPWGSPFFLHVRRHEAAFAEAPDFMHAAFLHAYIGGAIHAPLDPAEVEGLVTPWLDPVGQVAFYRQIAQADERHTEEIEPRYAEIRCPVQIIWGAEDSWIPLATGQRLHRAIPGSAFSAVPGAGHLVQLEAAEQVAALLRVFFAG